MSAELFQELRSSGGGMRSVQSHETFNIGDIPFSEFSEDDLVVAAKVIEEHIPKDNNFQEQVA